MDDGCARLRSTPETDAHGCVDPSTGALRAETLYAAATEPDWTPVETIGGKMLVVGGGFPTLGIGDYLDAVSLPAACLG